jgi:hypothetical protein
MLLLLSLKFLNIVVVVVVVLLGAFDNIAFVHDSTSRPKLAPCRDREYVRCVVTRAEQTSM